MLDTETMEELERGLEACLRKIENLEAELFNKKGIHNELLRKYQRTRNQRQREVWAQNGLAPCVNCRRIVPRHTLSFLYLTPRESGTSGYEMIPLAVVREIRLVCDKCRQKILQPIEHAAYPVRILAEKREDRFYLFADGQYRPLRSFLFCDNVVVHEEVSPDAVDPRDRTIGKNFQVLYA